MCGSSSTTTTVPFSALTLPAFHLPHPELPEWGHPLQNHHVCRTRLFTPGAHHGHAAAPQREAPRREEQACRHVRTDPIRLGAVALASATAWAGRRMAAGGRAPARYAPAAAARTRSRRRWRASRPRRPRDITKRVNALNAAIAKVNGAKGLGSGPGHAGVVPGHGHRAAAAAEHEDPGRPRRCSRRRPTSTTIFSDFRVYLLVLPALADRRRRRPDHHHRAIPALTSASTKAQAHVNATNQAAAAAADHRPEQPDQRRDQARPTGWPATVLGYTPAQWNANNEPAGARRSRSTSGRRAIRRRVRT